MFEAYKVGITLALQNNVSAGLRQINKDLLIAQSKIDLFQKALTQAGTKSKQFVTQINSTRRAIDRLNTTMGKTPANWGANIKMPPAGVMPGGGSSSGGGSGGGKRREGISNAEMRHLGYQMRRAGETGFFGIERGYESAKDYESALSQFKSLQLGDAVNKDADRFARGSKIIGSSATDLIMSVKEMHTVLANYDEAKMLAPLVAQMEYANAAVGGKGSSRFDERQRQMLGKVMEYRGGFAGTDAMWTQGNYMQRVMSGTGFMVLPSDYRNVLARGGIAAQQMSDEAFYYKNEPMVQMMGGQAVGVGLNTAYSRMIFGSGAGGPGGKAYIELLDKLGLVKPDHIEHNKLTGKITKVKADFLKDSALYKKDEYEFLESVLVPALRGAGYDEAGIETAIAQIYGNTGGKVMNQYHRQFAQGKIQSKVAIDANAMDAAALIKLAQSSPAGAEKAARASWENLKTETGEAVLPVIVPGLLKLASAMRELGGWIRQHPIKFDYIIAGVAGLAAVLAGTGVALTLAAAISGIGAVIGIAGGAGALGALIAFGAVVGGIAATIGKSNLAKVGSFTDAVGASKFNPLNWAQSWGEWATHGLRRDGATMGNVVPSSRPQQTTIRIDVKDKYGLARVVSEVQEGQGRKPLSSPSSFDGRLHPQWGF